jgi:MFS family permease
VAPGAATRRRALLTLLVATQFLVVLLDTDVALALPAIRRELGFSRVSLQWVQSAYLITAGGFLLAGGRAADFFGRRRVLASGLWLYAAFTLVCGLAGTRATLVGARAVSGVGAAVAGAAALSILTVTFRSGHARNSALGAWGIASGLAAALGPAIGGILTDAFGWSAVFLTLVPVQVAVVVGVLLALPPDPRPAPAGAVDLADAAGPADAGEATGAADLARTTDLLSTTEPVGTTEPASTAAQEPPDVAGSLLATGALTLLIYAITSTASSGWGSTRTLAALAAALAFATLFALRERMARAPVVPPRVWRLRNLAGGNAVALLFGAVVIGIFVLLAIYVQDTMGYSARQAGLALLPLGVAELIASMSAARLIGRLGFRGVLAVGMLMLAAAMLGFTRLHHGASYATSVLPAGVLFGAGIGLAFVSAVVACTEDLGHGADAGLASGLVNTSVQLGGALGLAIVSAVASGATGALSVAGADASVSLTRGFHHALLIAAALAAAGALIAWSVLGVPDRAAR